MLSFGDYVGDRGSTCVHLVISTKRDIKMSLAEHDDKKTLYTIIGVEFQI